MGVRTDGWSGGWIVWGYDWLGWVIVVLSLGLGLVLGDCVWCVLLPKPVANATISSKTTPRLVMANSADNTCYHPSMLSYGNKNYVKWYWKPHYRVLKSLSSGLALHEDSFCVLPPHYTSPSFSLPSILLTSTRSNVSRETYTTLLLYTTKLHFTTLNHYHVNTLLH